MNPNRQNRGFPGGNEPFPHATEVESEAPSGDGADSGDDGTEQVGHADALGETSEHTSQLPDAGTAILEFIERVRSHSPDCLADLLPDSTTTGVASTAQVDAQRTARQSASDWRSQASVVAGFALTNLDDLPTQIGRFRILRTLGEGGFGLVFLAHDPELDREVALKLPRPEALMSEETRGRYLREAKTVASLNHPNIATVYEAGQIGPICYIVSAYCRGGALSDLIENVIAPARSLGRSDSMAETSAQSITYTSISSLMATLAKAVQHAHDRGILHRDLKPSNILFEEDVAGDVPQPPAADERRLHTTGPGPDPCASWPQAARIVDFGLAKSLHSDAPRTRSGMTLGTPSYMSPEQARGDSSVIGPTTDVYSLGAILYELLTGKPPFQKTSEVETIIAVKCDDPIAPRRIHRACPKDLEAICLTCLEKEPARRYTTAGLLAEDLDRFSRGEPVRARSPSAPTRYWRWCRRYPLAALLGIVVVTLAIVSPLVAIDQARLYEAAEQARQDVGRTLYTSDMNLALRDWEEANIERCGELLMRHLPQPGGRDYRAFEWYYLWRLWHESEQVPVIARVDDLEIMALSPDESLLALGCYDGTILLADRESGRTLVQWQAHPYRTYAIAFAPDGKTLASASVDNEVKLWEVATHSELADLSGSRTVAFSPVDGSLAYRTSGTSIGILDPGGSQPHVIPDAHDVGVGCVTYSPDGKFLASGGWDGKVRIWDAKTRSRQMDLPGHDHWVWSLDWSPDGNYLATGDVYGTVKLWNASTGTELIRVDGHSATVLSLKFAADSATLASGAADNTIKLWKVPTGWEIKKLQGHYGSVNSLAFAAGGTRLLSASIDGDVKSWTIADETSRDLLQHPDAATSVAFSSDNKTLATSCSDGHVRLWDVATGALLHSFAAHQGGAWRVRYLTRDSREFLVSTGHDSVMRLWDVESRRMVREFACRPDIGNPVPVAVSADHSRLAFPDGDITVTVWDLSIDVAMNQITLGGVSDVEFSPDGRTLLAASADLIKLRDAATGDEICAARSDPRFVICATFSPDGQTLATGSYDRTVKFWDVGNLTRGGLDSAKPRRVLRGPSGPVLAVAYSPDGSALASAGSDQVIRLWDPVTGRQRAALAGHKADVHDVAFSPDGQILASAGNDFVVRLWRAPKRVESAPGH